MKFKFKRRKRIFRELVGILIIVCLLVGGYFGLQFFLNTDMPLVAVVSGSMYPTLKVGDLVVVKGAPPAEIQEGDIIVFEATESGYGTYWVHRVIEVRVLPDGTRLFITKGDKNAGPDSAPVSEDKIHGRVIYIIPFIGFLIMDPIFLFILLLSIIIIILLWPEMRKKGSSR